MKKIKRETLIKAAASVIFFAVVAAALIWLNTPGPDAAETAARRREYATARVVEVLFDNAEPAGGHAEGRRLGRQDLLLTILDGGRRGEELLLTNFLSVLGNVDVGVGDRIIVQIIHNADGTYQPVIHNYDRWSVVGVFVLVFIAVMAAIGGKKGVLSLMGLGFTIICLWFILIPMVLRGVNPILASVVIVAVTATATLILLDGFTRKALSAILGCVAGVSAAGLSAALVGRLTPLDGFNMGHAEELMLQTAYPDLNLSGLLVCGIFVAALGAVMDVSMTIASAISEMRKLNPRMPAKALFASGMNIGKDAMGTMANTLVLAFFGASLSMVVLARAYDIQFIQLINTDWMAIEILQSVAGTLGIVLTVPFVSFIAAHIISREPAGKGRKVSP